MSDSDWSDSEWSEDEEESEPPAWEADTSALQKDIKLDTYKKKSPAWTLGRRDERALEEKCAPGPGVYERPGEQHLQHFSRRGAKPTMAGKPLVLLGTSPGPADYDYKLKHTNNEHPVYSLRTRLPLDDGWLCKTPAPNRYRVKVDQVRESHPRFTIQTRPPAKAVDGVEPGPSHYHPMPEQREGFTMGYRLDMPEDNLKVPAPTDYNPAPVDRLSSPAYTWGKGQRFKDLPPPKKEKKKDTSPKKRLVPKQTRSSIMRATLKSRTGPLELPGSPQATARMAMKSTDPYDESGDGGVWPTPEACAKDEDVRIIEERARGWDGRPASGRGTLLSRRDLRVQKSSHATYNRQNNPYTVYQDYLQSASTPERHRRLQRRGQEGLTMYKKFTTLGLSKAAGTGSSQQQEET